MAITKSLFRTNLAWTEWLDPYIQGHSEMFLNGRDFMVLDKSNSGGIYARANLGCLLFMRYPAFRGYYNFP
jgi:hypothetical protein